MPPLRSENEAFAGWSAGSFLEHAPKRLFGRNFSQPSELIRFLEQFDGADQLVSRLVDPDRLLFDSEWSGPLSARVQRYAEEIRAMTGSAMGIGEAVYNAISGRMIVANDVVFRSSRYQGTPLINAPTSWQYFQWKYEYDSDDSGERPRDTRVLLISKALESRMLSELPPDTLIELRRHGASAELREIIGKGIQEIKVLPHFRCKLTLRRSTSN
jgi:hypothetical protein